MRISSISFIVNFLFITSLLVPCIYSENTIKKKVTEAVNAVNEKLNKNDNKKKTLILAGVTTAAIAVISALIGGAYFIKEKRKPQWKDPAVVTDVYDVLMDTLDDGVLHTKRGYYSGKTITDSLPSDKTLRQYILRNIRHSGLELTSSEKNEILSMIPYIKFNIRKLVYGFADVE
ncbi:early transcribed membrane protein [Plasmodium gonderi]|uniref:Early transcribed membrane protein n=1 Tax=Plasmodium gonderi TaxID=77519 RepID=A0A1Y1JBI3_PLAGO|nr:early transcribed membrane protein [Plasmodium gonderi]GAW79610.1 early transcribed membrane protein [Plasmodium gonderi]